MEILNGIDWASLPVAISLGLILLSSLYVLLKMMQAVGTMQKNALEAGTGAITKAIDAFREGSAEQRTFYTSKLEDMRAGVRLLEDRVRDLEEEGEEKDKRIEELEAEVKQLRRENDQLREKVNEKQKRDTRRSAGRAAADK